MTSHDFFDFFRRAPSWPMVALIGSLPLGPAALRTRDLTWRLGWPVNGGLKVMRPLFWRLKIDSFKPWFQS